MNKPYVPDDAPKGNGSRRPVQIMAEINQTREEMDQTLSAIEHRLTPGQLVDQGLDYLKHSGAREYAANLGASLKTHPLPATLAGIGIAWMMAVGSRPAQPASSAASGPGVGERMHSAKDAVSGKVQSAKESLTGGMQSARESLTGRVQSTRESLASGVQSARERASQLGDTAGRQIERVREGWGQIMEENPLVLGAVGLAIGALAAALAPRTRAEDELMGETRDGLIEQAKRAGSAKLEEAKQMASSTVNTVKDAAADAATRQAENPAQGKQSKFTPPGKQQDRQGDGGSAPRKDAPWPYPAASAEEKFEDSTKWPPSAKP
jgi:hypothetical protein